MALLHHRIDDFVNLTLPHLKRYRWTDISMEYQEYISSTLIDEKKVQEKGGSQISFRLKTRNTGNARNSGLFAEDRTKVEDVTVAASVPWAMQTTSFAYDIYEELFQSDRETIIKELQIRDHEAMCDMAELNEENLWTSPTGTNDDRPLGIPHWIVKNTSVQADGGFNGGNPSGFSGGCAGLDSTTYPRWRNWTFKYDAVSPRDFVKKAKKAIAFTNFQPPVPHPELGYGKVDYQAFTTYRLNDECERLAESRNDNLGPDLAKYRNQVLIAGVPMKWVPWLEQNDTSDPIYGVNFKVFRPFVKTGCDMRRNPPKQSARQHTVREVHIDNWMNYVCVNRRACWVGCKG